MAPSADPDRSPYPAIAVETSGRPGTVALALSAGEVRWRPLADGGDLAGQLLPALDALCRESDTDRRRLALVVVGTGPGSFTGLRAGVAVAATLARYREVPLVALPSLEGSALATESGLIAICLDALRGEIQGAVYADGEEVMPPTLAGAEDFATLLANLAAERGETGRVGGSGTAHLVAGPGVPAGWTIHPEEEWEPRADRLLRRGIVRAGRGDGVAPTGVEPLYLRPSAAEERKGTP